MSRNLQTKIGLLRQEVSYITKLVEGMRRDIPDRSATGFNLSNWDVSSVTTMSAMFYGCSSATGFNLSNWDVSSVTNMSAMFYGCSFSCEGGQWDKGNRVLTFG